MDENPVLCLCLLLPCMNAGVLLWLNGRVVRARRSSLLSIHFD